jgi:periplasmic protein TonB
MEVSMERQPLRSHLSGTVPISIAVHVVVVLVVLIIPLTAVDVSLMVPSTRLPDYIRAVPIPAPPLPVRPVPRVAASRPAADVSLAPTSAPSFIRPETEMPGPPPDLAIVDTGGVPYGIGAVVSIGQSAPPRPPDPPRAAGPVRIADLPVPPRKTVDARPVYPEIARVSRVQGTVVMEAVLDPTGSVTQLRIVRSVPLLDQAAMDAVRRWKYTPSIYGGHPVSVLMTITIRFTLQE